MPETIRKLSSHARKTSLNMQNLHQGVGFQLGESLIPQKNAKKSQNKDWKNHKMTSARS